MNIGKALGIFGIYVAFAALVSTIFDLALEISTGFAISNLLSIFVGLLVTVITVWFTIGMTIKEVGGNKVLLAVNLLDRQYLPGEQGGQTLFNYYYTGINFLWWWEKEEYTVNLEADIAKAFEFTVSTLDDDILVTVQYDVEPDPNNLSVYVLNGKDEKDREKNIVLRVTTSLKRAVEIFLSGYPSDEVVQNKNDIVEGENGLQQYLVATLEAEASCLGIHIKKVRVGNIDYSKSVSEARNDKKTVKMRVEAIKEAIDDLEIEPKEAIAFVQAETGKAHKIIFDLKAPEGLKVIALGEAMGGILNSKKGSK